jgi:hypothetical protein
MPIYDDIQIPGGPTTPVQIAQVDKCRLEWTARKRKAEAEAKYKDAQKKAREFKEKLKALKSGGLGLLNDLAADAVAALGFVATQLAAAVLGVAAGALNKILEMIFSQILKIIMAGPESIFALIKFPQDKAILHTKKESTYLLESQTNLRIILRIINKYLNGFDSDIYYKSMKKALPYISQAIDLIEEMVTQLNVGDTGASPKFDTAKFDAIMASIDAAIEATIPKSVLLQKTGIDKGLEQSRIENRDKYDREDQAWYNVEKNKIDNTYRSMMDSLRKNGVPGAKGIGSAILTELQEADLNRRLSGIEAEYQTKLEILKGQFDYRMEQNKAQAEIDSFSFANNKKMAKISANQIEKTKQEFMDDMNDLSINLRKMLLNVKDAFLEYKMSQFFTGVTYTSIERIQSIIKWMISQIYKVSKTSANGTLPLMEFSKEMLQNVELNFIEDTTKYTNGEVGAAKLALDLSAGNIKLRTAQATLFGFVTPSLIAMINFDSLLKKEKDRFESFRNGPKVSLYNIKDFRGEVGIWGTNNPEGLSELTMYISLIQQIGSTIVNAPIQMLSKRKEDKVALSRTIRTMDAKFEEIIDHNRQVLSTLSSYRPYQSGMVNQLKTLIDAAVPYLSFAFMALDIVSAMNAANNAYDTEVECKPMWNIWDKIDGDKTTAPTSESVDKDSSQAATAASSASGEAAVEWEPMNVVSPTEGAKDGPVPSSLGLWINDNDDVDAKIRKQYYEQ